MSVSFERTTQNSLPMWHRLDQVRIWRTVPVPLPLDTERIIQMIADCHLQVRQRNLAFE
jgi:hypothetical protein